VETKIITGASDVILRVNILGQSGFLSLGVRGNQSWAKHVTSDGFPLRALYKDQKKNKILPFQFGMLCK